MRWLVCAGAWIAANVAGLAVASQTKFGPVVLELSDRHGVHVGDVLALLGGVAVAVAVTGVVWATSPSRPSGRMVVAWLACAALWQVAVVVSLFLAASTEWGPVLARPWRGKAVHLGDVAVVAVAVAVATALTLAVRAAGRRSPGRARRRGSVGPMATTSPAVDDGARR